MRTKDRKRHNEGHVVARIGWLRAAVLGANDGLISTAALMVGVAAAEASRGSILVSGVAGLVAGAMSMAAGEYVSVSSQKDVEKAELDREKFELAEYPEAELAELREIYVQRGLSEDLAGQVAEALTAHDALGAHARDELGLTEAAAARPIEAAGASAVTFSAGAAIPLIVAVLSPQAVVGPAIAVATVLGLVGLGALGAWAGGAPMLRPVLRVTFWGLMALAVTALVGRLFGAVA